MDASGSSGMHESDRERRGHRIRISQKKSDEAVLTQQVQILALKQGKTVPADRIRELFSPLSDTVCLSTDRLWSSRFKEIVREISSIRLPPSLLISM